MEAQIELETRKILPLTVTSATQLRNAKIAYKEASLSLSEQSKSEQLKTRDIPQLRNLLLRAIDNLSAEELARLTDLGGYDSTSLVAFFAEIGEVSLFIKAFKKAKDELEEEEFLRLFVILFNAYEGSRICEALMLSSNLLKRGEPCFIAMAEWMLHQLEDHGHLVLEAFLNNNLRKPYNIEAILDAERLAERYSLDEYVTKTWEFKRKEYMFYDEGKVTKELTRQYHEFVTQPQKEHLFWQLINKYYALNQYTQTYSNQIDKVSSKLLLDVVTSNQLVAAGVVFVVLGAIGVVLGPLGLAGFIASMTSTLSLGVAIAGGVSAGVGVGLSMLGIFGKDARTEIEKEKAFYSDYQMPVPA